MPGSASISPATRAIDERCRLRGAPGQGARTATGSWAMRSRSCPRRRPKSLRSSPASTTGSRPSWTRSRRSAPRAKKRTTFRRWPTTLGASRKCGRWRREERAELMAAMPAKEEALKVLLLPADEADERNAILEIRAGTGGDEAALFAGDLLRMYQRYVEGKSWRFELMSMSETGLGGVKEVVVSIGGRGAYARLKFEVRRAPRAASGRRPRPAGASTPRRRPSPFCPRRRTSISRSTRRTFASTSIAPAGRAGKASTPPTAPCASPICRAASSSPSRTRNRSTRTRPRP